jgi:multidrug efflux pump subunit AcrA (membrane-fusion protein)
MKGLPIIAIAALGAASACSVDQRSAAPPAPVPAKTAAATTAPIENETTTSGTSMPGMMVLNNYDPPLRVPVSR